MVYGLVQLGSIVISGGQCNLCEEVDSVLCFVPGIKYVAKTLKSHNASADCNSALSSSFFFF